MAPGQWWREAARVKTISLAVACAGAAWALHRYRRKHRDRPDSGTDCCSPERHVRHLGRRRLSSEDLRSQAPREDRRLAAHADAALKLNELYLTALDGSSGELEAAYGPEAPLGIVCAVRPRCLCATAAVTATVVAATLMALHAAITVSLGLSLLVLLGGAVGAAALALHWAELKTLAPRQARAAIARASVEVQPEATEAAWRSALAWASAPPAAPGRIRSFAQRGSHCILVEASPSALVAAPLDAFVLEPRGAEDSGGLRISSYTVPASRKPALELTASASARLRQLLGEALATDADDAEAAGGLGPGLSGCGRAGRPLLRPLAALRGLRRLEAGGDDTSQVLDKGSLERLRIAGQLYDSCHAHLATPLTSSYWMAHEKNKETGIEWAIRLDAATSTVVIAWEVDVPHTDVIKVVAVMMEWDMRAGSEMEPEVKSARELCKDQGNPYISTWNVITDKEDSRVGKEDMVAHAVCFDRLADPQGNVLLITSPAQKGSGEYLGDSLPPKLEGYVRPSPDNFLWAATLTPLGRPGAADRRRGFRLRGAFRLSEQSEALCKVGSRTPSFLLRQLARPQVELASSPVNLVHVVETRASELEERLRSSPRAELYEQLRRQLCGERST